MDGSPSCFFFLFGFVVFAFRFVRIVRGTGRKLLPPHIYQCILKRPNVFSEAEKHSYWLGFCGCAIFLYFLLLEHHLVLCTRIQRLCCRVLHFFFSALFFPFLVHIHVHHDGWWADLRMMLELPLKSLMDAALILGTLFTVSFILFVLQTFQNTLSRIKAKIRQDNIAFSYSFLAWLS